MKSVVLFCLFIACQTAQSQGNPHLDKVLECLLYHKVDEAKKLLNNHPLSEESEILAWHVHYYTNGSNDSLALPSNTTKSSYFSTALNQVKQADLYHQNYSDKDSLTFQNYKSAIDLAINNQDSTLAKFTIYKMLNYMFDNRKSYDVLENYNALFKKYALTPDDRAIYTYFKYTPESFVNKQPCIEVYQNALNTIDTSNNDYLKGMLYLIIGNQQSYFLKEHKRAIMNFEKAAYYFNKVSGITGKEKMFGIYNNIGAAYNFDNDPKNALIYLKKASTHYIPEKEYLKKSYLYLALAQTHKSLTNYDSAYFYLNKEKEALKLHKEYENARQIAEIETKYQTEKKEKENLQLRASNLESEAKRKQNQNIALGLGGSLVLTSIIALLVFKNSKRKQKLAEQAKEIESQKLATVLKEQELNAIDAMIEGQEKERQRIANDLHDDLGGLMATLKLHFNALKDKNSPELYKKTNILIDEAYEKVRSVAHAKNSGVIAKQGLLKAVKQMAEKISASDTIKINVIDHGLDERLENSLELTIFRIVQELITNVLKHAQASEINIHITNHDEVLNIMVEDDGIGFNPSQITKTKKGMGISSIDKRIEHLNGKMTIESINKQGTTIIIDIPL